MEPSSVDLRLTSFTALQNVVVMVQTNCSSSETHPSHMVVTVCETGKYASPDLHQLFHPYSNVSKSATPPDRHSRIFFLKPKCKLRVPPSAYFQMPLHRNVHFQDPVKAQHPLSLHGRNRGPQSSMRISRSSEAGCCQCWWHVVCWAKRLIRNRTDPRPNDCRNRKFTDLTEGQGVTVKNGNVGFS